MNRGIAAAAVLVPLAILAAGCGSPGPAYFVYAGGSGANRAVVLIQWATPQNGQLTGSMTVDSIDSSSSPQEALSVQTVPFTGTINGSAVTLRPSGLFGLGGVTLAGSLGSGSLSITVPPDSSTGAIQTGTLTAAGVSTYNTDVAKLRAAISSVNVEVARAQAAQQQEQQLTQAQGTVQGDTSTLQQDAGPGGNLPGDLQTLSGDVQTIKSDVGTVQQDLAQGGNSYCYNQSSAATDANGADTDTAGLGTDVQGMLTDIQTIQQDISTLRSDLATLQSDGGFTPPAATAAIKAARAAIRHAVATANSDIQQGNAYDQQAFSIANAAATGSCSGDGPGQPQNLVQQIR